MTKIRIALSALLILPFLALGANLDSAELGGPVQATADAVQSDAYRCCWVFHNGAWWCVPC